MKNEEAKFILAAYRPDGQDAGDPRFAEALMQAQIDPQLKEWLNASLEWDAKVGKALRASPVPPNLKASILAGQKVIAMPQARTRVSWMAVAAALVLLGLAGGMLTYHHFEKPSFAELQHELPEFMAGIKGLQLMTDDLDEVRAYLDAQDAHGDLEVPEGLQGLPSMGCRVFDWHDRKVALVCFRTSERQGRVAHLLVMDVKDFRDAPDTQLAIAEQDAWSTAGWRQGNHVYLLATAPGGPAARSLVRPAF
jgi:hypothetical protein